MKITQLYLLAILLSFFGSASLSAKHLLTHIDLTDSTDASLVIEAEDCHEHKSLAEDCGLCRVINNKTDFIIGALAFEKSIDLFLTQTAPNSSQCYSQRPRYADAPKTSPPRS